jgi:hypothetical protein
MGPASCVAYFSALLMEVVYPYPSEMLVNFFQTAYCYIPIVFFIFNTVETSSRIHDSNHWSSDPTHHEAYILVHTSICITPY